MRVRVVLLCCVIAACGREDRDRRGDAGTLPDAGVDAGAGDSGAPDSGGELAFALTSTAYAEGDMIPLRHECGPPLIADGRGENVSPPLAWTDGPPATQSYAIVMRDLDAGGLVHWVIYDIPATTRALLENIPGVYMPIAVDGAKQAELQGSGVFGYFGPCSPTSVNTYELVIHALDQPTLPGVDRTTTEDDVAAAVESMSIASASLSGES